MEHPSGILVTFSILLAVCMAFAGCSESSDSGGSGATATATSAGPLYTAGDIVQTASGGSTGYLIVSYDSATDSYTRAIIHKNSNGSWGYRTNANTDTIVRAEFEKIYTVSAGHVTVSSIPTRAPTAVPTTTVTTKTTSATVKTTATTKTTSSAAKPLIKSIDPEGGKAGESVDMTITGSNFKDGATVKLTKSGETTITATDVSVDASSQITCTFDIPSGTPVSVGWSIVVTNSDGKSGELANYFTVHEGDTSTPAITKITPTSGYQGDSISMTITGSNFKNGAIVELTKSGKTITASDVNVASETKIICTFKIPSNAATGSWSVVVTNSNDKYGKLASAFTIE